MAWLVMTTSWSCEHFGWLGTSYVLTEVDHHQKKRTVGSPGQSNSSFSSSKQVEGFEAQGWQFEAGIEKTDGSRQGFEAFGIEQSREEVLA